MFYSWMECFRSGAIFFLIFKRIQFKFAINYLWYLLLYDNTFSLALLPLFIPISKELFSFIPSISVFRVMRYPCYFFWRIVVTGNLQHNSMNYIILQWEFTILFFFNFLHWCCLNNWCFQGNEVFLNIRYLFIFNVYNLYSITFLKVQLFFYNNSFSGGRFPLFFQVFVLMII